MDTLDWAKPKAHRLTYFFLTVALLGLITLVYYPALSGPLVLDDFGSVTPSAISELSWSEIWRVATSNQSGMFGRPIPVVSFALNMHFWPDNVLALKITNLAIHLANTFLVFFLARLILKHSLENQSEYQIAVLALVTTTIWAIHPLQVSAIMYVVQRMTLLMTFFTLISVLLYARYRINPPETKIKTLSASILILLFAVLACLCKENGALTFLYIALLEITLFRKSTDKPKKPGEVGIPAICCYIPLALGIAAFFLLLDRFVAGYSFRNFDLTQRLLTEPGVLVMYLKMIVLPNLDDMQFYYDSYPVVVSPNTSALLSIALLAALIVVAIASIKKYPLLSIGIGIFFLSHALESTFINLELVFEHRNYLAILGVSILVTWIASFAIKSKLKPSVAILPVVTIVTVLGAQAHSRSVEWSDATTLNSFALQASPDSVRARTSLAVHLHNIKKTQESLDLLRQGLTTNPDSPIIGALLLHLLAANGELTQDETLVISDFIAKGTITKAIVFELTNIHRSVKGGRLDLNPHLLRSIFEIALNNPKKRLAGQSEAMLLGNYADLLMTLGEHTAAIKAINAAIEFDESDKSYVTLQTIIKSQISKSKQAELD